MENRALLVEWTTTSYARLGCIANMITFFLIFLNLFICLTTNKVEFDVRKGGKIIKHEKTTGVKSGRGTNLKMTSDAMYSLQVALMHTICAEQCLN